MRIVLAILLLIGTGFNDIDRIAKANKLKKEAREAFQNGDYSTAISNYHYLLDSMKMDDDKIRLNLASAYYQSKDTANSQSGYSGLTASNNKLVQSTAHQQLGVIQNQQKKYKEALQSFKNALKADPTNEGARYNYEMLKKLIKEQEEQQDQDKDNKDQNKEKQDQENKEQENKEQQEEDQKKKEGESEEENKEQQEKEGEEGEEKEEQPKEGEQEENEKDAEQKEMPEQSENMKEMKISEEKAKMILEAMKNNEIQYFQQNKRKPTKRKDSGKPDW